MVDQMLIYNTIQSGEEKEIIKFKPIDLKKFIEDILSDFAFKATQDGTKLSFHGEKLFTNTNKNRLKHALINLVSNSLKFASGKNIRVELQKIQSTDKPICIDIIDEGCGIKD